jgi:hypothetical protein
MSRFRLSLVMYEVATSERRLKIATMIKIAKCKSY